MATASSYTNRTPGRLAGAVLLFLVTAALFYPVAGFQFIDFDDQRHILEDPALRELSLANLRTILLEPYSAIWYPLTRLSHALEYAAFGASPGGVHLVNATLHFLNALALFAVLAALGGNVFPDEHRQRNVRLAALVAALLFAVHPQHVEVVAWAVQRKELLATLFSLLAINLHQRRRLLGAGLLMAAAMLCKASAVVLPAMFVLLDTALSDRGSTHRRLAAAAWSNRWFLLLALAGATLTMITHRSSDALFFDAQFTQLTRLFLYAANSLDGLWRFLALEPGLFHQPMGSHVLAGDFTAMAALAGALALLAAAALLLFAGSRPVRVAAAGLLFYFVALLPVGGLVVFGNYAFGDRYLYLGSVGIYIFFGMPLAAGLRHPGTASWVRTLVGAALLAVLAAAAWQSHRTLPKFRTTETVWADDVARRPDSVFAQHQLGSYYFLEGRHDLAYRHFEASIDSATDPFRVASREASALYMAEIQCNRGQAGEAIAVLERIPGFGGDMRLVELLVDSLRHAGREDCADTIDGWYRALPP